MDKHKSVSVQSHGKNITIHVNDTAHCYEEETSALSLLR